MGRQTKYKTYNALSLCLKKAGIKKQGTVATLLLDIFLKNDGALKAAHAIEKGLCKKGQFTSWRSKLEAKGFIKFNFIENHRSWYEPGLKLNKYLNREKIEHFELATKSDLNQFPRKEEVPTKQEFEAMKERIEALEKAMQKEIEKDDPPFNPDKLEARLRMVTT